MIQEETDKIKIHTETMIKGFFDEFRWLSNFYECPVYYDGLFFSSSEAAYQSAKTLDEYGKQRFLSLSPSKAKKLGTEIKVRKDWPEVKVSIMKEILLDKFTRNEDLKQLLIDTRDMYLVEENYWGDTFWGSCNGKGKNILGILLMEIRNQITNQII